MNSMIRPAFRKRRDVRFSPAPPDGSQSSFPLEPRVLARPAFFIEAGAGIVNQAQTTATNGTNSVNVSSASSSGTATATAGGFFGLPLVTFQQVGLVTSQIVDFGSPGSGTYTVSMSLTQDHQMSVSNNPAGFGPNGGPLAFTTTAAGNRTYLLADDGTTPSGGSVTLVQTLDFTLTGPANPGNVVITGGFGFAGVGFNVAAVYPAAPQVTATASGTTVTSSSSTSGGITSFHLTASTPYSAGLPLTPGGVQVAIAYGSTLTTTLGSGSNLTDQVEVSMNYAAHF